MGIGIFYPGMALFFIGLAIIICSILLYFARLRIKRHAIKPSQGPVTAQRQEEPAGRQGPWGFLIGVFFAAVGAVLLFLSIL